MREIKFRAWDEVSKVMHNDFQFVKSGNAGDDWVLFTSDKQPISNHARWVNNPHFQQQLKIMQYTGLKDKNGKEIYEGDICTRGEDRWAVRWAHTDAMFFLEALFDDSWSLIFDDLEVIGNVYKTPELLEAK